MEIWNREFFADFPRNSYISSSFTLISSRGGKVIHIVQPPCVLAPNAGRSLVIDNLRPQTNSRNPKKVGVIQFYFDDHDPNFQTADDVVRSFVKQIVYQMSDNEVPEKLGNLYDTQIRQGKAAEPTTDQFVALLGECFDKFTMVYICIDAFDECVPEEGAKVLNGLQQLSCQKYRLFLTGRTHMLEDPKIRDNPETQIWLRDAEYQPIAATRPDIETYLNDHLHTTASTPYMDKIRPRIVEAISSQSNGQYVSYFVHSVMRRFLLARFQLEYLLRFSSQPKKLVQALNDLPPTMRDIYDDIMKVIDSSPDGDKDLAYKALSWVFHTANGTGSRPLRMDEILDLVATEIGETKVTEEYEKSLPDDLLHVCRGLVIIDTVTNTVRFPHLTVLEYFRNATHLKPLSYLAQTCLTYLAFDEFETECTDWNGVQARLKRHKACEFLANY